MSQVRDAAEPEAEAELGELLVALRGKGGRVTTARRALLGAMLERGGHCSAEELAEAVSVAHPGVRLSTVYRNLEELERLGVVVHAHLGHGAASYHLASRAHGHLVCEHCGVEIETPDELFASLAQAAAQRWGFRVNPWHSAVSGTCADCLASDRAREIRP